LTDSFY